MGVATALTQYLAKSRYCVRHRAASAHGESFGKRRGEPRPCQPRCQGGCPQERRRTRGVALRGAHHCPQPLIRAFGVDDAARASLAPYTKDADIEALLNGLEELVQRKPSQSNRRRCCAHEV